MTGSNTNRFSTYTTASTGTGTGYDGKHGSADRKELWSSMLDSVASGKRLPEKKMLVLGGGVESQREFYDALAAGELRGGSKAEKTRRPPVANGFALGYTYYDVLDADHEDTLARISLHTLASPSPAYARLLRPLLTPKSIPHTLVVVLLDWAQPWRWMRQLRGWILLLRTVLLASTDEARDAMEALMLAWRDRGRAGGLTLDGTGLPAAATETGEAALPPGPGEWEDALGLPLCVVCQNANQMEILEKTQGWKEEEFDVVLQFMRTVLLKHGASLIYTAPSAPSQLPSLIHSSLGIHSLLKRNPLRHNVIDRDKIVVPPNWDSWGKIRVLREGFDVERVSSGWSIDLDQPIRMPDEAEIETDLGHADGPLQPPVESPAADPEGSTVVLYEESVEDPTMDALQLAGRTTYATGLEVETLDTQIFFGQQLKHLDFYKQQQKQEGSSSSGGGGNEVATRRSDDNASAHDPDAKVTKHIGPVQFNMGGIQVDADDMVQRLKDRQTYASSDVGDADDAIEAPPAIEDLDKLSDFFQGLMHKKDRG